MLHDSDILALLKNDATREEGFSSLFVRYFKVLIRICHAKVQDVDAAEDLAQQVLIDFWRQQLFHKISDDGLGYYLAKMCAFRCATYLQKLQKQKREHAEWLHAVPTFQRPTFDKDNLLQNIKDALYRLPPQQYLAVRMTYFERLSYNEAALALGISINSFKQNLKHGIKKMRTHLRHFR